MSSRLFLLAEEQEMSLDVTYCSEVEKCLHPAELLEFAYVGGRQWFPVAFSSSWSFYHAHKNQEILHC